MKRIIFILSALLLSAGVFASPLFTNLTLIINGSWSITANGDSYWYQMTGYGAGSAWIEDDGSTCDPIWYGSTGVGNWIEPQEGGYLKIWGSFLPLEGFPEYTSLNVTVKPYNRVEGNNNLYLVDHGAPHGTYVIGELYNEFEGSIQDYQYSITGASSYLLIGISATTIKICWQSAGLNYVKYKIKQNGVWGDWFSRDVWVSNPL